ncbi:metal ABC transporter substrate-binding protein [Ammoniphilus oxalaticus]|uniref:Lipoprotein n=1 Tax=Ammoniphilus oxalaticus TaxID=66863 RepID=A0A419SDN7_9BACL|nr:MetQ/NlpA family ABC transporter substrate-binding protein [Ammoniphilus oxalaticus]RKD21003.1 metal ABC transporter substrate-binding protein [Ammoniphilus oxalaticus]
MKKFFTPFLILLSGLVLLAGCGGGQQATDNNKEGATGEADTNVTLIVGASPTPHAEILEEVKPLLAEQGITLDVTEFTDYVIPNQALDSKDLDANFFQHKPYMDKFNEEHGTKLVAEAITHFEPLGIYPGKTKSLEDLENGAHISIPNDPTNEARALQLLQAQGLITINEDAGLNATTSDVVGNPKNIVFRELEAATIPRMIDEVDYAVINGNYAIDAGFTIADALATESADSLAAETYANILAVREGEDRDAVKKLAAALNSPEIKKFIEEKYEGSVVPLF